MFPFNFILTELIYELERYGGHSAKGFSAKSFQRIGISENKIKRKNFERRDHIAKNFSAKCKVGETANEGEGVSAGEGEDSLFCISQFYFSLLCIFAEMCFSLIFFR
jgi:hypothetical protein